MDLYGFTVNVVFLVNEGNVIAYSWHFSRAKAFKQLKKIMEYHMLSGEIIESPELENWLKKEISRVVEEGLKCRLPSISYRNRIVYEVINEIPRGRTITYSDVARKAGIKYSELLLALLRNPLQILIPCHRLLTKTGKLMGFYPLGVEVKKKLLKIEGVKVP